MTNLKQMKYKVVGLMSGTSLDGVDIAFCTFEYANNKWLYTIEQAETIAYPSAWKAELVAIETSNALHFLQLDAEYGYYLGRLVNDFITKHNLKPDFVASHGHTIFHAPFQTHVLKNERNESYNMRLTTQLGAGSSITAICKLPVVCDFRSVDVALGGQGAPLVPIGDKLLFSEYDFCLNIGGFTNISYEYQQQRIAFDICPANIVLNALCETIGKPYDDGGKLAVAGIANEALLSELNKLPFYQLPNDSPKSLGKEWVLEHINPLLQKYNLSVENALSTVCEHIAMQLANVLNTKHTGRLLITGGGVFNDYLISRIKHHTVHEAVIPAANIVNFKEALLFAFLGVLRMRNEVNCLQSVTGASMDNVGGAIYSSAQN
jgi:anhydro-N-acetylmuramic acid kinase